jgi:cardiolipin synthase
MFIEEYLADLRRERYSLRAWIHYVRRAVAMSREQAFHRPATMRSLGLTGIAGFVVLLVCAVVLSLGVDVALALRFFRNTGTALLIGLLWMASHIRMLTDSTGRPLERINPANVLTLSRLVLIPAIVAFMAEGLPVLALVTFLLGAATDVADGWLARHMDDATPLGRVFDPVVDILFNAAVIWSLFGQGLVPAWIVALVLTRYCLLLSGAAVIYIFRGPVEIKPTVLGKATGVVTTLIISTLVVGGLLLPRPAYSGIADLLAAALGFVEAITIPQVILIGWYNYKRAGGRAEAALHLVDLKRRFP